MIGVALEPSKRPFSTGELHTRTTRDQTTTDTAENDYWWQRCLGSLGLVNYSTHSHEITAKAVLADEAAFDAESSISAVIDFLIEEYLMEKLPESGDTAMSQISDAPK